MSDPFDHKYVNPALEFNTTVSPSHNEADPLAVMVGIAGKGFTMTFTATD